MIRGTLLTLAMAAVVLAASTADSTGEEPKSSAAVAKLAPSLTTRLTTEQPIVLVVLLEPGSETEPFTRHVERLGGHLVQRFTLIDAATVVVPGISIMRLAELAQVRSIEPADSGVPPPGQR